MAGRLIDADALINRIDKIIETNHLDSQMVWFTPSGAKLLVDEQPTIEPERKRGKWIVKAINTFELAYGSTAYEPVYECSLCGGVEESYLRLDEPIMPEDASFPKFCPNCGADMREGEQNDR